MTHESNGALEREIPCKWSFESWIKKYNLFHLQEILFQNSLNSLDECLSFARAYDIVRKIESLFNKHNNKNNINVTHQDLINCEYAFNSLLKLQQRKDFLVFLDKLSKTKHGKNSEWALIFVDCDDIKSLLNEKKIRMINVENSMNLLQATICRMIDDDDKNGIAGYHLGGDLFALFVNDNHGMTKSITIVECLLKIMSNKNKSSFTISCGIGIRRLINDNDNMPKKKTETEKEKDRLQREWVLRAHVNLLRAKENGKNCYFYQLVSQNLSAVCFYSHTLLVVYLNRKLKTGQNGCKQEQPRFRSNV